MSTLLSLLCNLAIIVIVNAGVNDEILIEELKAKFPGVQITKFELSPVVQQIRTGVHNGTDIDEKFMSSFNVAFEYQIYSDRNRRIVGSSSWNRGPFRITKRNPVSDAEFLRVANIGVDKLCRDSMTKLVKEHAEFVLELAAMNQKLTEIQLTVESAGYTTNDVYINTVVFYKLTTVTK